MIFGEIKFDQMNEADVREDIISPLLSKLGYKKGTEFDITRAQPLRYPRNILGLKKKSDPILRGEADYICYVKDQIRWVIEAKSPHINICVDDLEQAYSYAVHQEVRAIYYCLCNGKTISFYETMKGAIDTPLLSVSYENLANDFQKIFNIVSPDSLTRNYPNYKIDIGKPLAPGLRSIGRISNGFIKYNHANISVPALMEMIMPIKYGSVERDQNDNLLAYIEVISPFQSLQELNEKLGLDKMELKSTNSILSIDINKPTCFESTQNIILPAGISILDINSWKKITLPANVHCEARTIAKGYLENNRFSGEFQANLFYENNGLNVNLKGEFEIFIY